METQKFNSWIFVIYLILGIISTIIALIILMPSASAWSATTFNNSLSAENLTFINNQNITRYLAVPSSISKIINGYLNLSGYDTIRAIIANFTPVDIFTTNQYNSRLDFSDTLNLYAYKENYPNSQATQLYNTDFTANKTIPAIFSRESGVAISNDSIYSLGSSGGTSSWDRIIQLNLSGTNIANYTIPIITSTNYPSITWDAQNNKLLLGFYITLWDGGPDFANLALYNIDGTLNRTERNAVTSVDKMDLAYYDNKFYIPTSSSSTGEINELNASNISQSLYSYSVPECYLSDGGGSISTTGLFVKDGYLYVACYNNKVHRIALNSSVPTNTSIYIGSNKVWNYTNQFTEINNKTLNLKTYLNNYLTTCSYISGYCNIPFVFNSNNSGIIRYSDLIFNSLGFIENSQSYSNSTTSGITETFIINITYDSGSYSPTAYLIYNGTSYTGTQVGTGSTVLFTKSISVPVVSTNTNFTFYWNISLDGVTYTSTKANQSIYPITLDNCSSNTVLLYNFTLRDEASRSIFAYPITNGTFNIDLLLSGYGTTNQVLNFSHAYNSTAQKIVCANVNFSKYRVDMVADYVANGYVKKFYFIDNGTLQNFSLPYKIDLHDLPTADSTSFLFEFTDANGLSVENAIVHTFRKYIGDGIFREVERSKQDNNGQTIVHLVEEDVIYYFMVTKDSNVLYTSDNYNAKCLSTPCEISLSASTSLINWSLGDEEGGKYSVSYNQATRVITLNFNLNGETALVNMSLYKYINGTETFINYTSLTSASGSMSLTAPLVYGNATFFVVIYRDNVFVKSVWVDLTEGGINYFGTMGAILGALILLALMLMAVTEGAGFIVITIFGVIVIGIMKLVDLGWMAIISIICAGAVIVWKLVSGRQKS